MTKRDIAILALRIMAIVAIFYAIPHFTFTGIIIYSILSGESTFHESLLQLIYTVIPLISYLVFAAILWRKSLTLSDRMIAGMDTHESKSIVTGKAGQNFRFDQL